MQNYGFQYQEFAQQIEVIPLVLPRFWAVTISSRISICLPLNLLAGFLEINLGLFKRRLAFKPTRFPELTETHR